MKKLLTVIVFSIGMVGAPSAYAFDLVEDIPALIQFIVGEVSKNAHQIKVEFDNTVAAVKRVEQVQQLTKTYNQAVEAYNAITGIRDVGVVTIEKAVGQLEGASTMKYMDKDGSMVEGLAYLPSSYEDGLKKVVSGGGNNTFIDTATASYKDYVGNLAGFSTDDKVDINKSQVAYNRALAALAYQQSSQRLPEIMQLKKQIQSSPEDKQIQDLQANMLAYQALLQNEQLKLQSLILLQQAQMNVEQQKTKQRQIDSLTMKITPATVVAGAVAWTFDK